MKTSHCLSILCSLAVGGCSLINAFKELPPDSSGQGGTGGGCQAPVDCPPPTGDCTVASCSAQGECGETNAAAGTLCKDGTRVCDGGGVCGDLALGQPCVEADTCDSVLCVDGVCCATVCAEPCRSCNLVGRAGSCDPQPLGEDLKKAVGRGPQECVRIFAVQRPGRMWRIAPR